MALSPIQMFQNNGSNSIEGLLRAGPEAISSIMNQAISLGRSMADKQLAQERDLFAMRQQETNLMQRRAENAQQLIGDNIRFNRSAFEADRRYGLEQQTQSRISANDAFSQDIAERKMGLLESQFESEQAAAEEEKRKRAADLLRFGEQYGDGAGTKTEEIVPTPTDNPRVSEVDKEIDALKKKKEDYATRFPDSPFDPTASIASLEAERTALTKSPKSARPTAVDVLSPTPTAPAPNDLRKTREELARVEMDLKNPALQGEARVNAEVRSQELKDQEKKLTAEPDAPKAPSTTAAAEERQFRTMVLDTTTFPDQRSVLEKGGAKPDDPRYAQADAYEKDKFENEIRSAINKSEDAYAALGGNPEERRKFHQFAMRRKGGSTTTPSTPTSNIPGFNPTYD